MPESDGSVLGALGELARRRPMLDQMDDRISAMLSEVEVALRLHIAVRVEVDIGDGDALVFGKVNNAWQLLWRHGDREEPLISRPRGMRAEAFALGWIEKLLLSSVAQMDCNIALREKALAEADRLVAALRAPLKEKTDG